jgi:hypothetical protein
MYENKYLKEFDSIYYQLTIHTYFHKQSRSTPDACSSLINLIRWYVNKAKTKEWNSIDMSNTKQKCEVDRIFIFFVMVVSFIYCEVFALFY